MGSNQKMTRPGKYAKVPGQAKKKSGHPTQPGNRSNAPHNNDKKRGAIIPQKVRKFKRKKWGRVAAVVLSLLLLLGGPLILHLYDTEWREDPTAPTDPTGTTEETLPEPERTFVGQTDTPVDLEALTDAWCLVAGFSKRYELTDTERWEVASVVTAETTGEPFAGMVAVAQCILQSCEDDGIRPMDVLAKYCYAKSRPDPSPEALAAVQAVFDFGQVASLEPIKYFYAPARTHSDWHESQVYVMTINGHKFFKEAE